MFGTRVVSSFSVFMIRFCNLIQCMFCIFLWFYSTRDTIYNMYTILLRLFNYNWNNYLISLCVPFDGFTFSRLVYTILIRTPWTAFILKQLPVRVPALIAVMFVLYHCYIDICILNFLSGSFPSWHNYSAHSVVYSVRN